MAIATNRSSPRRYWRSRWLFCQGFLLSPLVIAALLLVLSGWNAASKGLPESAAGAGPSRHGSSQGENVGGGSGAVNRRKRDRLPSSARPVPTTQSDHDWKTRRKPPATSSPAAAAGEQGRRRPRPQQQAATKATGAKGAPDEDGEDEEEESSSGLGFDSDSGELDYFSWSDDGDEDGWSDGDGDGEEEDSDWGRGAAGGPGGRGKPRRRQGTKGGGAGVVGAGAGSSMMSMTDLRSRLNVARQRASSMYREAKSLMSSEMEGVVLKATRPDDLPVKPKHLEALMRPTAEMPKEFNVYLPVVRKLWSKMADKEWRVAAKALYIVHRFAADGSIEHASNLKESVAVLRTHHDSRRKANYFDIDTICDVKAPSWSGEDVAPMAEFLRGYADFVLRRTTQFGPAFAELLDSFAMLAGGGEVMASVEGLVSTGSKCCELREEQEGAVTVAAALQVAQDVRDVVEVCAAQLDYLAREWHARSAYPKEVERWYAFLYEKIEPVEALISRASELAEKHKLPALRPLAAAPLVLKLRDEEVALEKQAALEAQRQQQCSMDEGEQQTPRPQQSHAEQAGAAGFKAAGRKEAAVRDRVGEVEDQAVVSRRQQGTRGREESAPPSSPPADAPGDPAGAVAARKKVRSTKSTKGRGTAAAKSSSSRSAAGAAQTKSTTSGGGGTARQPAVRRPGGGTGTGTAAAAPHHGDGTKSTPSQGASATADGGAKSRAPRKKRSPSSSVGSKAPGREERPAKPSSGTGGEQQGASAGATAAGGSGSSSSREQKQRVRGDSSAPKKERSKKLSPRSEKPPRSG